MAPTKFLMFLWGQTPAFDEYLRSSYAQKMWNKIIDDKSHVSGHSERPQPPWPHKNRWIFSEWTNALNLIGGKLRENLLLRLKIKELNEIYFGSKTDNCIVPYGFFIDAYLWQSRSESYNTEQSETP